MSLKITSILLLLLCLNITLADQNCKVKLYAEQDYQGNHVETIYGDTSIKHEVVKSLLIFGDCKWNMYRQLFYKDFPFSSTYIFNKFMVTYFNYLYSNKKLFSKLVPGQELNKFAHHPRPPYYFRKMPRPFRHRSLGK